MSMLSETLLQCDYYYCLFYVMMYVTRPGVNGYNIQYRFVFHFIQNKLSAKGFDEKRMVYHMGFYNYIGQYFSEVLKNIIEKKCRTISEWLA